MKTGPITYTMIDVTPIRTGTLQPSSYRITLSRGGVNGGSESATIDVETTTLESLVHRATALLLKSGK